MLIRPYTTPNSSQEWRALEDAVFTVPEDMIILWAELRLGVHETICAGAGRYRERRYARSVRLIVPDGTIVAFTEKVAAYPHLLPYRASRRAESFPHLRPIETKQPTMALCQRFGIDYHAFGNGFGFRSASDMLMIKLAL